MITVADILDSQAWRETVEGLLLELHEQIETIPPDHTEGLKGIALRLWAIREVQAELESRAQKDRPERGTTRGKTNAR